MTKSPSLFALSETFRRDFLMGLGVWLGLEFFTFALFPGAGIIQPGTRYQGWFLLSIIFGVMGAFLLALSPMWIARDRQRPNKTIRNLLVLGWRLVAWFGLAGLAFPLLVLSYELFARLFDQLIQG
ncbi:MULTISPECIES: hypothetical protein [unclassified Leptolyngbya]|uniref:hypothetical protein n=1 Tax=unclassified Leptolyngbya TaxID=2650499 RepID=UPI0016848F23|nr:MULTISPECIES: hypothetical protein [unclassified Leptolyngbya]MBD1911810.1 hypothetical protein [Leptolyngbya sp. FACHB-8]MBD2153300.1 hypothetical protein [Leptolyngbya sp. FACHB-16]